MRGGRPGPNTKSCASATSADMFDDGLDGVCCGKVAHVGDEGLVGGTNIVVVAG